MKGYRKAIVNNVSRFLAVVIVVLLCTIVIVSFLFAGLLSNYRKNITSESTEHLEEVSYQIRLYVEERIRSDWKITESIRNSIQQSINRGDDALLFEYLKTVKDIWNISDLVIYTEDGQCFSVNGEVRDNASASDLVYYARLHGFYQVIRQSAITFTVPVESEMRMNNSRIAAVSVVQNISTFLDNMELSSFDGNAFIYLTQEDGVVISKLSNPKAPDTYNIFALLEQRELYTLDNEKQSLEEMADNTGSTACVLEEKSEKYYLLTMPIQARQENLRIFYWVPVGVVNASTNSFSFYALLLSITVIIFFFIAAILLFLSAYRNRKARMDHALSSRERMFDMLVQNTSTAFALFELGREAPLYYSSNAKRIFGLNSLALVRGEEGYQLICDIETGSETIKQLNMELLSWNGKEEFQSSYIPFIVNGAVRYYTIYLYPVEKSDVEFVAIAQDVTTIRAREEALGEALSLADQASAAKTTFLSNMSHDIRTPMNAIVNMTEFAIDTVGQESQTEYLQIIRDSSRHLLQLINDILDMSRIESGQAIILQEEFLLSECLDEVGEMIRSLALGKRQQIVTDYKRVNAAYLLGDKLKLKQILINLLSNAVKFTPEGGTIRFYVIEMPTPRSDVVSLKFIVADNGIGISKDSLPNIFAPFTRGEHRYVGKQEGTGLGLSICRSYVKAMGGRIYCSSIVGEGSEFTVELSFTAVEKQEEITEERGVEDYSFKGMRALLCEDNEINRMIACRMFENIGFTVESAEDGREGLEMFLKSPAGYYDIIYMDIQMPIMDGYQATTAIRKSKHPEAETIPIIAMTANVFTEDVERARVAGMNGHLGKPIIMEDLIKTSGEMIAKNAIIGKS